jgi:hypothetical protein
VEGWSIIPYRMKMEAADEKGVWQGDILVAAGASRTTFQVLTMNFSLSFQHIKLSSE